MRIDSGAYFTWRCGWSVILKTGSSLINLMLRCRYVNEFVYNDKGLNGDFALLSENCSTHVELCELPRKAIRFVGFFMLPASDHVAVAAIRGGWLRRKKPLVFSALGAAAS